MSLRHRFATNVIIAAPVAGVTVLTLYPFVGIWRSGLIALLVTTLVLLYVDERREAKRDKR